MVRELMFNLNSVAIRSATPLITRIAKAGAPIQPGAVPRHNIRKVTQDIARYRYYEYKRKY